MIIRKLRTHAEYLAAEDIQRIVWHFPEREVIPLNELVVAQKNGGHVFGAFDRGKLVAFCFGVPGFSDGRVYHYSRMLGVLPRWQDTGIGHRMKLMQRDYVREQGLKLVRWTFDPLQSRNAHLNIEKLGCVIREYVVNIYGESGSSFNRGLETDRFVVEWWIASKRTRDRLAGRGRTLLGEPLTLPAATRPLKERRVTIEIPSEIDEVKKLDLKRAQRWRFDTRAQFLKCFKRGYVINGFATNPVTRRSYYVLEKDFVVK